MKGTSMGVAILAMIVMAQLMVHPSVAITCNDVTGNLTPCLPYLRSGGKPTPACCAGAKKLLGATRTQADRRTACKCAKTAAPQLKVRPDMASSLPGKCGISTSIPINPNVNCNTIP
ncbi:Non-specific lipid-transfer protein AP10 [Helianthus annuus]|uniref:Non-specific lipid-transfer protein AP10 n=2 Tax=Helianthus annuus TaxID=4232 RepID=NLTP1_HELAN|nr:non-specific lipid-transfer protein AP10 precursor [Helianthus annuus]P82007.2 RecName: Full=Non-specific lipid-transfer protein AP10; Short=Ha-AP10; Short=LTP; Short=NsLTP; Flags: Precursor [Helianthus annuus]AAP47226.1 putative lipid transfer protein [Helianthus annuus]KAF5763814.1 putative plant lipid transfer protein/Par allergen [Helianthus annuus]KAJ0692565.1 Non-specific lipid-transfer protein AP10 [Helianthus annuus]KAJ0830542.1 Non-specific lipid-transfer protein AP10 [Helianthus a